MEDRDTNILSKLTLQQICPWTATGVHLEQLAPRLHAHKISEI